LDCDVIVGDVADYETVRDAVQGVDGCFHLAAIASVERSRLDWIGAHRINLGGMVNLLDCVRPEKLSRQIPVIYASSASIYGDNPAIPLAEDATPRPLSAYGADKLSCELQAQVGANVHGIPSVGFRFFNVFGPRQDPSSPYSGVISIFARKLLYGERVKIFGDGEQVRDFIYVSDIVRLLLAAVKDPPKGAEVFNACTGQGVTVNYLCDLLGDILGIEPQTDHLEPRPGDIRQSIGNPLLAGRRFNVSAEHKLRDSLAETVSWMRNVEN